MHNAQNLHSIKIIHGRSQYSRQSKMYGAFVLSQSTQYILDVVGERPRGAPSVWYVEAHALSCNLT